MTKILFVAMMAIARASPAGYQPVSWESGGVTETRPVLSLNNRPRIASDGHWINCAPIRIDEGIWDAQRLTHLDLPEVWFTNSAVCHYDIAGPKNALEFFALEQATQGENQATAKIKLIKRLDREIQNVHSIEVVALDCSGSVLKSQSIEIVVGDINDHIPWIDAASLHMIFCPDMEVDTVLGYLKGSDQDIGAYADLLYQFTHRKPYGTQIIVTRMNGQTEMMDNIFSLNGKTGEVKLVVKDPRIDDTVKTISVEVAVRDHPGNPIFGQRTAQLIFTLCNQPPLVEKCNLGYIKENAVAGSVFLDTDILVRDSDPNIVNTIVGFQPEDSLTGSIQIIPTTVDGVTTAVVKVDRPFNYEKESAEAVDGRKTLSLQVHLTNPKANEAVDVVHECMLTIVDDDDPHVWNMKELRGAQLSVKEECESEVGVCVDRGMVYAIDEDNFGKDIEYSANDEFFNVYTNRENQRARICLKKVIDREKDCTATLEGRSIHRRHYPLRVIATESGIMIDTIVYIECIDINDNYPTVTLSPAPYPGVVCEQLDRNFSDYYFLEQHDLNDVKIHDAVDGKEIVAIALINDLDNPEDGHTYPYTITVTSENKDEITIFPSSNPNVFFVAYSGSRSRLEASEEIVFTVEDNGISLNDITTHCAPDLRQPQVQIVDNAPFGHMLHACDCDGNEDDEYYPHKSTCSYIGLGGLWWIPLLLLALLLLLCILCFCCYQYCCAPAPAATEETTKYVYKYEKPDWYYYLYNLMAVKDKQDIAVDNAVVEHPADMCGVLDKSKQEADKVFHTYDEKRIYNIESVPTDKAPLINNRLSMVSGVSELSRMTGMTAQTANTKQVDWQNLLHGVPEIQQVQVEDRAASALSNVTDVTVNENKINILRSHHLIASKNKAATLDAAANRRPSHPGATPTRQTVNLVPTNQGASFYSQGAGLQRSPSRVSHASGADLRYGTTRSVDVLQRARSPVASLRHTENRIIYNEDVNIINFGDTDSELGDEVDITLTDVRGANATLI